MELVTVGTGTVAPSATRTSACHWVSRGSLKILLDCGAGALHRLAQFGLPWHQVTHVILSHFHPDHWGELPMLVYALKYTTVPPRQESLVILGPRGRVRLVKQIAEGYGGSEERRVGKEGRSRWSPYHLKKKKNSAIGEQ